MAVTWVTHSTATNNDFEPALPTGYDATYPIAGTWGPGDFIGFFALWYDDDTDLFTAPAGFTQPGIKSVASETNISVCEFCWKIAGASEPATYNGGGGAEADYNNAMCVILRGTDPTAPVGASSANSGEGTTVTWTGLTPPRNDSISLFLHVGYNNPAGAIGGTPTATERVNALDSVNDLYSATYSTADTGDRTATVSSDTWNALHVNIQPPDSGGGGDVVTIDHHSVLSFPALCRKPRRERGEWIRSKGGLYVPRRRAA